MPSYEEVLDAIADIPNGVQGRDRTIQWLTAAQIVGAARDHLGHVELFLAGAEIRPRASALRAALQHHSWTRENDTTLDANRLLLPPFGYFDKVAALIATELLSEGADTDLPRAFTATEPLIELAIKRLEISKSALLGLAGELLLVDALVRRAEDQHVGQLVQAWDGWRRSMRDLSWNGTGVEVKTTTRSTSSHFVQGVHQLEPYSNTENQLGEERLLLASIGLQESKESANAFNVPQLTRRIVDRLQATGHSGGVDAFLSNVAAYGSETGFGYHHLTMAGDAPFTTWFTPTFVRAYNMSDPSVQVLRHEDLVAYQHVDLQSVVFQIDLPASISVTNPANGLFSVATAILGS